MAVSSAADSFFRLRPSGLCAPERPLLQRRLAGRGGFCAIYASGSGCAALPAPFSYRVICSTSWRLHAAARHTGDRLCTARIYQHSEALLAITTREIPARRVPPAPTCGRAAEDHHQRKTDALRVAGTDLPAALLTITARGIRVRFVPPAPTCRPRCWPSPPREDRRAARRRHRPAAALLAIIARGIQEFKESRSNCRG